MCKLQSVKKDTSNGVFFLTVICDGVEHRISASKYDIVQTALESFGTYENFKAGEHYLIYEEHCHNILKARNHEKSRDNNFCNQWKNSKKQGAIASGY